MHALCMHSAAVDQRMYVCAHQLLTLLENLSFVLPHLCCSPCIRLATCPLFSFTPPLLCCSTALVVGHKSHASSAKTTNLASAHAIEPVEHEAMTPVSAKVMVAQKALAQMPSPEEAKAPQALNLHTQRLQDDSAPKSVSTISYFFRVPLLLPFSSLLPYFFFFSIFFVISFPLAALVLAFLQCVPTCAACIAYFICVRLLNSILHPTPSPFLSPFLCLFLSPCL